MHKDYTCTLSSILSLSFTIPFKTINTPTSPNNNATMKSTTLATYSLDSKLYLPLTLQYEIWSKYRMHQYYSLFVEITFIHFTINSDTLYPKYINYCQSIHSYWNIPNTMNKFTSLTTSNKIITHNDYYQNIINILHHIKDMNKEILNNKYSSDTYNYSSRQYKHIVFLSKYQYPQ